MKIFLPRNSLMSFFAAIANPFFNSVVRKIWYWFLDKLRLNIKEADSSVLMDGSENVLSFHLVLEKLKIASSDSPMEI